MIKVLFLTITHKQLEFFLRAATICIGELFSPVWGILANVMKPYVDLQAIASSRVGVLTSITQVYQMLDSVEARELAYSLIPALVLCLLLSIVLLYAFNLLGGQLARFVIRMYSQPAVAE